MQSFDPWMQHDSLPECITASVYTIVSLLHHLAEATGTSSSMTALEVLGTGHFCLRIAQTVVAVTAQTTVAVTSSKRNMSGGEWLYNSGAPVNSQHLFANFVLCFSAIY